MQSYAAGLDVLEIGTLWGFSAIGMAMAGARITSVDPHYEGPTPQTADTWEPFLTNWRRYFPLEEWTNQMAWGLQLCAYRQPIEEFQFRYAGVAGGPYGLVFIDGDHGWPAPRRDIEIALAHLKPPGYIALHDVTMNWPPVWRAAGELEESGQARVIAWERTMRVYQAAAYQK